MYANAILHDLPRHRRRLFRVFVVNLIFGGALAVLMKLLSNNPRQLTVFFDNPHDLEKLRDQFPDQNFWTFPMGEGTTTWSLDPSHPTANSTGHGGFGARILNGTMAAQKLLETSDFKSFLESLPDQALIACDGAVNLVEVRAYGGLAGAACTGANTVIARAMLPPLLKVGAPLEWHSDFLGPITFLGVAERARMNAASALLSQTNLLVERNPSLSLSALSLMLHELPPYRDDIAQRNRHLLQDAVVMRSEEMQDYLRLVRPNWANSGPSGNIISRQVDLMAGLAPERDIASWVADHYQEELQARFEAAEADPLLVDDLRWSDESRPQQRETVPLILSSVQETETAELIDRLRKPPADHRFSLFATTAYGGEFQLERLSTNFAVTPTALEEFLERVKLLRTFRRRLMAEESVVQNEVTVLDAVIADLEAQFTRRHERLLRRQYLSRKRLLRKLESTAEVLRLESDTRALRQAELEAILRASTVVAHELRHHTDVIDDVIRELTPLIPRGSLQQVKQYVIPCRISDAFPMLLGLRQKPRETQNEKLCSLADQILPRGLAKIVGASNDRLETIARQIVFGEYALDCPPHGGRERSHTGTTLYSIPAIDPQTQEELSQLVRRFDERAKLICHDTMEFGATVARTRFYRFGTIQDLYDGLPGADLIDATTDVYAQLNSAEGFAGLDQIKAGDGNDGADAVRP
jgi:hypothetical protein